MDIQFSKIDVLLELVQRLIKRQLHQMNHTPKIEVSQIQKSKIEQMNITLGNKESKEEEPLREEPMKMPFQIEEEETPYVPLKVDPFYEKEETHDNKTVNPRKFKQLYPVGIVHATYIVCQNEDGMTLIDQHAAKERCNYELFKKKLGEVNQNAIRPLISLTYEFQTNEFIILKENFTILTNIGFEIEEFGVSSVIVKKHPTWLPAGQEKEAILRILEAVIAFEKNFTVEKFNEKVATMLSCKLAIKANDYIDSQEVEKLLDDLEHCENPFHCPHGRPTMIHFSKEELEKLFKRSGF